MPFKYQHVIISQKTGIIVHTAARTSNVAHRSSSFYFTSVWYLWSTYYKVSTFLSQRITAVYCGCHWNQSYWISFFNI